MHSSRKPDFGFIQFGTCLLYCSLQTSGAEQLTISALKWLPTDAALFVTGTTNIYAGKSIAESTSRAGSKALSDAEGAPDRQKEWLSFGQVGWHAAWHGRHRSCLKDARHCCPLKLSSLPQVWCRSGHCCLHALASCYKAAAHQSWETFPQGKGLGELL